MKHTPGRGHRRKSDPIKKRRFQKKAAEQKEAAQKAYKEALKRWENMSEDARKLEPELHPDNFKSYLVEGEIK